MEKKLGYFFKNKKLLKQALIHSSVKHLGTAFDRLEFLGDRVLALSISSYLYKKTEDNVGEMAKKISSLINAETCAEVAASIGLENVIETANNEILRTNQTVLADAIEAVIGSIYLDSNFKIAEEVVIRLWFNFLQNNTQSVLDPKTTLQEFSQKIDGSMPIYKVVSKTGTEHDPSFVVELNVLNIVLEGKGKSKKLAEIDAAQKAVEILLFNQL